MKNTSMTPGLIIILLVSLWLPACFTMEKSEQTADGQIIPGKKFPHLAEYEYVCEPTLNKNHAEMEQLLDRYGNKGWKLAGFMHKSGDTYAFCMMR